MTVTLYIAPAGGGKTAYVVEEARRAAGGLRAMPRICVASALQRWSVRRRLAAGPGALGVHTLLFDDLYKAILQEAGQYYTDLSDPVQYRLLRTLVAGLDLPYYARLVERPGFIQALQQLIAELKAARIQPATLAQQVQQSDERLVELARIYAAYQQQLQEQRWADRAGMGWLALGCLADNQALAAGWSHLFVDGFDSFTVVQRDFLNALAGRVGRLTITLTGEPGDDDDGRAALRRFIETRQRLESELGLQAAKLPAAQLPDGPPLLRHLQSALFRHEAARLEGDDAVQLLAAPDRAGEVREALRWLKEQQVESGLPLHQFALLAREMDGYRPFVERLASSFGLPIYAPAGAPLGQNPLVAALLGLLRLMLPGGDGQGYALPRLGVVAAWRSPYFNWPGAAIAIAPGDAERLDAAARQGRVVGGYRQWQEALALQPAAAAEGEAAPQAAGGDLPGKFAAFVERLRPPDRATFRDYVAWLEDLIGGDETAPGGPDRPETPPAGRSLQMVAALHSGEPALQARDRAALLALKEVLRGLVVAEATLGTPAPVPFAHFFQELAGAVEASFVQSQGEPDGALVVSSIQQARGLPFAAVAVLGLGEGSFPASLREDPFLREEDRRLLREGGLPVESSVASREREFFYETVSRPWQRLLLARARLADDGAVWEPSPFWQETRRLVAVEPQELGSGDLPPPWRAANNAELLQSLVARPGQLERQLLASAKLAERWQGLQRAASIFALRYRRRASAHNGDLQTIAGQLRQSYGPAHIWSASQIETYLSCAHRFLCEPALKLRPRPEGEFTLDAAQLGLIYHNILDQVYRAVPAAQRGDAEALLAALERVAPPILDAAPEALGFRPAAWWPQSRAEITATVARTLQELAALADGYTPLEFERWFGEQRPLKLAHNGETILLRGVIDRIDRDEQGRVRLIDYKSGGLQHYTAPGLERGQHVQLPLYALAAQQALGLDPPSDAFYWSVREARASLLRLAPDNLEQHTATAVAHTLRAVEGARQGQFAPQPPADGCPPFCAAAAFCWHLRPRRNR